MTINVYSTMEPMIERDQESSIMRLNGSMSNKNMQDDIKKYSILLKVCFCGLNLFHHQSKSDFE